MAIPADVRSLIRDGDLTRSDPFDTLVRTAASIGLYVGPLSLAISTGSAWAWVGFWIVGAFVIAGAYAAIHEAIHGSLFRSSLANDIAGVLWGLPILVPYAVYRTFHFQHHVYTKTDRDPEPQDPPTNRLGFALIAPLANVLLTSMLWLEFARMIAGRPSAYARRTARRTLAVVNLVAIVVFVAIVFALAGSSTRLLAAWVIPALAGAVLGGLAVAGEHYGCVRETDDMFLNSRTVKTNPVARFFLWNANYHTAHHLAPMVTGKNLPELHAAIADRCAFVESSFSSFYGKTLADPLHAERRSQELVRAASAVVDASDESEYAGRAGQRL